MSNFDCGLCAKFHPTTEFDGAKTRMPLVDDTGKPDNWVHAGKTGAIIGYCPIAMDWAIKLDDGIIVYSGDMGEIINAQ